MIEQLLRTPLTELTGVRHPVVQTGMGWVSGPRLVTGTANAGGLGILASATMTHEELDRAIVEVRQRTDQPAGWGADAVMIQGGEGGGHTGSVPTTLLLPTVLDALRRSGSDIPVIAAGGFFDGRGLAAALSYGAAGVGMGTRFLLTRDSAVPDAVKQLYLSHGLDGTVVTDKVDGMPHRMLRTDLVEELQESSALRRMGPTVRRTVEFKRQSGLSWRQLARDGREMRRAQGRSLAQTALAANTPMMLRAGLVEGDTSAGVLASGQVVGVIDDLPTCEELIDRLVTEASGELRRAASYVD
jgi:NAD(P)H-dependent flavin oxidoreductase YrpB (nitropropane dioxygenase family)